MSAGTTPALAREGVIERKAPRYKLAVPLDLTVLRAGIPDRIAARTLEIGEGGLGVLASSQLLVGESVRVEFLLPHMNTPVRATAVVRYQRERSFGLQFLRLPLEQQSIIRYWTRSAGELFLPGQAHRAAGPDPLPPEPQTESHPVADIEDRASQQRTYGIGRIAGFAAAMLLIVIALGWWQWQHGWAVLEARALANEPAKPQYQLPAEVMQRRLWHKALPEYPESARLAGVQGTVVLNVVVDAEGAVIQVKAISGPEELRGAAADAARWWRFEPYAVNGQRAAVETTLSMDFRLAN